MLWNGVSYTTVVPLTYICILFFISQSASLQHISEHHKTAFGRQLNHPEKETLCQAQNLIKNAWCNS